MLRSPARFTNVVSTGSGIALSFLPIARAHRADCHYIESFTRTDGPSLTGRVLQRVPGVRLYSQYPGWARAPWRYGGSVFDAFAPGPARPRPARLGSVVVTLGTMRDYQFRRLVKQMIELLDHPTEVLWQTGCTEIEDLGVAGRAQMPADELSAAIRAADVVVAHAGCGSAMTALAAGKKPVLVPRECAHGENVDDHQSLLAAELDRRELAVVRSPASLTVADLLDAAGCTVKTIPADPFRLMGHEA